MSLKPTVLSMEINYCISVQVYYILYTSSSINKYIQNNIIIIICSPILKNPMNIEIVIIVGYYILFPRDNKSNCGSELWKVIYYPLFTIGINTNTK